MDQITTTAEVTNMYDKDVVCDNKDEDYVKSTPVTAEDYLRKEIMKGSA